MTSIRFPRSLWVVLVVASCADPDAGPAGPRPVDEGPTWNGDLAPIVYRSCVGCHRDGGVAPFSLLDYETAVAFGPLLAHVTAARTMPPMPVDNSGQCNTYENARWLTDTEIAVFGDWVEAGMLEGDPALAPEAPDAPRGVSDPDVVLDMGVEYAPDPTADDDYRCFVVETGLSDSQFVTAWEVVPGDARVVHHLIGFSLADDEAVARVRELDDADAGPGYRCFGGVGAAASPLVLWAPGGGRTELPAGTGLPIDGRPIVLQLHYNLARGSFPDRSVIRLRTVPAVERGARFVAIRDAEMELPPRMDYVETSHEVQAPGTGSALVHGVLPHMHGLGRTLRVDAVRGGDTTCMVDVDRWDFEWQNAWFYEAPIEVAGGDRIRITCGYDTRERSDVTRWGEGTEDEMCLSYFYVTAP